MDSLYSDWCHGYGEQPTEHSRARHCLRAPCPRPLPQFVSPGGPWPAVDGAEDEVGGRFWTGIRECLLQQLCPSWVPLGTILGSGTEVARRDWGNTEWD